MTSIKKNAVYNLLGSAAPLILSLVTVPAYLKLVGSERFAILAVSWLLLGYFGLFDLGLGRATAYRIAAQRNASPRDRAETFWTALFANPMIGLAGSVLLYGAGVWYFTYMFQVRESLRAEVLAGLPLLALSVPVATLTGTLTGTLQGLERFKELNKISATSTALFQLLPLGVAWLAGPYLPWLLAAAIFARLSGCIHLGWLCWRAVGRGHPPRLSRPALKDLLGYGGWVAVTALIGPLLQMADRFVIGAALSAVAVAQYAVSMQLLQRVQIVPAAVASAYFPRWATAGPAEQRALSDEATAALLILLTPLLAAAIPLLEPFLVFWVGPELGRPAAPVARLLVLASWLNAIATVQVNLLYAQRKPVRVAAAFAIEAPIYALAINPAIQAFGLQGACFAVVLRWLIDLVLQTWSASGGSPSFAVVAGFGLLVTAIGVTMLVPPTLLAAVVAAAGLMAGTGLIVFLLNPVARRNSWLAMARRLASR